MTKKQIKCYNPATLESKGTIPVNTPDEVNQAVDRARNAQKDWAKTSFEERRQVFREFNKYILENQERICEISCEDTGKTMLEAMFGEVLTTCEKLRYLNQYGEKHLQPEKRTVPSLLLVKSARVEYHPLGVIGIIIPWNFPFHNMFSHVATALFTGNAAVVKASEWAAWSSSIYIQMFRDILESLGYDPEIVQLVNGYGETGGALVRSGIEKILFIGSPEIGRKVMEGACKNLTPVVLELGGKDPMIICDDADFDLSVAQAVRGVLTNCGQNCISAERIYVQSGIYDKFVDKVKSLFDQLRQGPPVSGADNFCDVGAMAMPDQLKKVESLIRDARDKGARVLSGGESNSELKGQFFQPTLIADATHEMRIMNEETFGPVMVISKFETDDEVIEKSNSTEYALFSSVMSTDYGRAERIAKELVAGGTVINDFGIPYLVQSVPFGGVRTSGFGKFNGPEGMREFCRQKTVVTDRFWMRTPAPAFTLYPMHPNNWRIAGEATRLVYSPSWMESFQAGYRMLKMMLSGNN
eukprot:gb/GECH01012550.1/.p1 GENE.gb/GECH01012550.1/~~gb/GECH01012550.1/.p1  ORF type:complete len:527 (+),score=123.05 gb/GECH01012550.1/:1-1581(+)